MLQYLYLQSTNISGDITLLDTTNNTSLIRFFINDTNITGNIDALSINHMPNFDQLNLSTTQISGDISGFDISSNTVLRYLTLSSTNIGGDISAWSYLPSATSLISLVLSHSDVTYDSTGGSLALHNMPTNTQILITHCELTSTMVDNILVDLATANKNGYAIYLNENNAIPSAIGNNAITTLTTPPLSWTVTVDS